MKKRILSLFFIVTMAFLFSSSVFAASIEQTTIIGKPSGLLYDTEGNLLITDLYNKVIWKKKDGTFTKLAGKIGVKNAVGIPTGGYQDGPADQAAFLSPWAIAPYRDGYAISDSENHAIRFFRDGAVHTATGTGNAGLAEGRGMQAAFSRPTGLAAGENGCLYIADTGNHRIRKLDANGNVTTYAGSSEGCADGSLSTAQFREPTGLCFSNGILYVADSGNHRICKIADGAVTTLAGGSGEKGGDAFYQGEYLDGNAAAAQFSNPQGVAVSGEIVYVADTGNGCIRKIAGGQVFTIASEKEISPVFPRGIVTDGSKLMVTDTFLDALFVVDPATSDPPPPAEEPATSQPPQKQTTYTVQPGDTLWKISRLLHCTINALATWNEIQNPNLIFPNQVLVLLRNSN